jgi:hypothetical protein
MTSPLSWRTAAIVAGIGILAVTSHTNVVAGSGYTSPSSWLLIAVAVGCAVTPYLGGWRLGESRRGHENRRQADPDRTGF